MLPEHLGTTKQEAATAMRRLEEATVAAMVGWAKAATEVERLTAERDRAKGIAEGLHKELRDAVAARGQAERERDEALKERREESAALDRVRELHKRFETDDGRAYCDGCRDSLAGAARYPCDTIRAIDGSGT